MYEYFLIVVRLSELLFYWINYFLLEGWIVILDIIYVIVLLFVYIFVGYVIYEVFILNDM